MPWWLTLLALAGGVVVGIVCLTLMGLWHVVRLLQADEDRDVELEEYPFP